MTAAINDPNVYLEESQENSFDALRLFAAYAVLFAHHFDLTKNVGPSLFGVGIGSLGVATFFALSGYLVAGSYFSDPSFARFMMRRIIRIFPALLICVLLTVFVVGVCLTTLHTEAYLTDKLTWTYLKTIVLNIQFYLPGVFENNPHPRAINGSLWTIPLEFKCYLLLALICWFFKGYRSWVLFAAVFFGAAFFLFKSNSNEQQLAFHTLHPLAFFVGVSYRAAVFEKTSERVFVSLVLVPTMLGYVIFFHESQVFNMMLVALLVVALGKRNFVKAPEFLRRNDISYGVYLYAFVVQQIVYSTDFQKAYFWSALVLVTCLTTACALLSCKFVEQPMLKFKPKRASRNEYA
jgi:peptidoglycan/LPS O-acetylase OafA/YrhL